MLVKLFVTNLPSSLEDPQLEELFSPHGDVISASVVREAETDLSCGFGFVEMEVSDIQVPILAVNGTEVDGSALRVKKADRPSG